MVGGVWCRCQRAGWIRVALLVAIAALGNGCAGDEREVSSCESARDHLVDLQLADANGVDKDAHRDAMKQALGATFLTSCKESMTTAQVRCILDAANPEHAKACVSP